MRDIKKPQKKTLWSADESERPSEPLPSPRELSKSTKKPPKPRFTGSNVPVASVPVPDEHAKQEPTQKRADSTPPKKPGSFSGTISQQLRPFPTSTRKVTEKEKVPKINKSKRRFDKSSPLPRPKKPSTRLGSRERKLLISLSVLVIVGLALAAYILLPSSVVTLVAKTAPLLLDQTVTLAGDGDVKNGVIPAMAFEREVQISGAMPVTSTEVVGKKASGTVQIVNDTVDEQPIREQSRLVTEDGTLFYMQRHAIVPPKSSVSVAVEAAEPGDEGNIEPQRLNFAALDESSQSLVYAELAQPLTNGSGEEVAVIKQEDIDRVSEAAVQAARSEVEQEIRSELESGWMLLEESWTGELDALVTDAELDARQDTISYEGLVVIRVLAFNEDTFQEGLQQSLESRLDENHMLFPGPISFTKSVDSVDWESERATVDVRVTHTTIPEFSIDTLQEKLAGRSKEEAENYLRGLPGIQSASVEISPFWASRISQLEKRIIIDIQPDRQP